MSEPTHVPGQLDLDGVPTPASPEAVRWPTPERVGIEVELYIDLPAADCWGGNPPDRWDLYTLRDEIEARYGGSFARWLEDWNLGAAGIAVRLIGGTGQPYVHVRGME